MSSKCPFNSNPVYFRRRAVPKPPTAWLLPLRRSQSLPISQRIPLHKTWSTYTVQMAKVQAGLAINDNYGMWLSHHQKLSYDGQKSSRHIRLDILNRFAKGISAKIVQRCQNEKHVFGLTINPNSNLGGFVSVLINPTPKCRFFDPTFMCDCLLVE